MEKEILFFIRDIFQSDKELASAIAYAKVLQIQFQFKFSWKS